MLVLSVCCHLHIQVLSVKLTTLNSVLFFVCVTKLHIETFFKVILNSFIAGLYPSPCLKLSSKVNLKIMFLSCFHSLCVLLFSQPPIFPFFVSFIICHVYLNNLNHVHCIVNHFVWLCIRIRRIKCLSVCLSVWYKRRSPNYLFLWYGVKSNMETCVWYLPNWQFAIVCYW